LVESELMRFKTRPCTLNPADADFAKTPRQVADKAPSVVIPNEVRNLSAFETQEKRDSSTRSVPRNDNVLGFSASCPAALLHWLALFSLLLFGMPGLAQMQAAIAASGSQDAAPVSHFFTDEIGRKVEVSTVVKHIVSLAPNLTEIVFALGEGDHLAGDTDFCDYPVEATQKPHVGGPINPNLEHVVALMPDLVLATKAINRRETVEALARIGVPVYVTDPHSVDDMISSVEHIGNVLHAEKTAVPLVEDLRERLSNLGRRMAGAVPRRVLFVVWTDPLISIGRGTFIADALRRAGARSVVDASAEWPRVNLEEIVRLQPEILVFASAHAGDTQHNIDALRAQPGWRSLEALRRGNIVIVSDAINRPAPRMVDAVEQLARAFHPDSFAHGGPRATPAYLAEEACACAR
jgi:iron complex transport system substrate-binding protein